MAALFVPLSLVLVQGGKSPGAGMLAANTEAQTSPPNRSFGRPDFVSIRLTIVSLRRNSPIVFRPRAKACRRYGARSRWGRSRRAACAPSLVRVASLTPTLTLPAQEREELTTLVSMKSSAFPYSGTNPRSEEPFLNISKGDRKGHRGSVAASIGRTRPTTTAACWCTSRKPSTSRSPA